MAENKRYPEHVLCGLCTHQVNNHNNIRGCTKCDCMATQGEANTPRVKPGAPVYYPKRAQPKPSRVINPFRVIFAPGPDAPTDNKNFPGHQSGSFEPWSGHATADEARAEAKSRRDRGGDNQYWIAVEIREI